MKASDFTITELQKIRGHYSTEEMAALFEGDVDLTIKYIRLHTLPPVNYVRQLPFNFLVEELINYGYPGMAQRYGVSVAFLQKIIQNHPSRGEPPFDGEPYWPPTYDDIGAALSPDIFAFSSVAALFGHKTKGKLSSVGNMEVNFGRFAETYYLAHRGTDILEDTNEIDPRAPYDFIDSEYGKVNVKASKVHYRAGGQKYWHFSTSSQENCDYLALIGFDQDKVVEFVAMIKSGIKTQKSFSVTAMELVDNPDYKVFNPR